MISQKFNIFAYPSYLTRAVQDYGYNPLMVLKTFRHCFGGFVFILIFTLVVETYHTTEIVCTAQIQKSDFIEYERGKSLIQREHPSNVQLPTTRQGLHSIPNIPAIPIGVVIDRTKGSLLFYLTTSIHSLVGMNIREELFNK